MNIKTTLAVSAIAFLVTTTASADDWTGLYAGANIGYSNSTLSIDGTDNFDGTKENFSGEMDSDNGIFGLKLGYDYQLNSQFVIGGFAGYSQFQGEGNDSDGDSVSVDIGYFDLAARVGYLVSPEIMAYVSAGYTQLGVKELSDEGYTPNGYSFGVGANYQLTDNWILNADYTIRSVSESERTDYTDGYSEGDATLETGALTVGVAYKF